MPTDSTPSISTLFHPLYTSAKDDWYKWRTCYEGGDAFLDYYLKQFSLREDADDFQRRKFYTPLPTFAASAIDNIRNAIFQRMSEITRVGGSTGYREAVAGQGGGVDLRGNSMNSYLGQEVLTEMMVMGQYGVYVDMPEEVGTTRAITSTNRPYLYGYRREDIKSWRLADASDASEFKAILLRDTDLQYNDRFNLPEKELDRYRYVFINEDTGKVNVQFFDSKQQQIDRYGQPSDLTIELDIDRIPFVLFDIKQSLMKNVANHQIALLNTASTNVNYAITSNFPIYTEQRDSRAVGAHLKRDNTADGTATGGGQGAADENIRVGASVGRRYDSGMERPGFINPSAETLRVSMELEERLEQSINKLVHLAVTNLSTRASGESKKQDNQGLEAGLSHLGSVLAKGERLVTEYWAAYEDRDVKTRSVAVIHYPDKYSVKTDEQRVEEASKLSELMFKLPGLKGKKEIAKLMADSLFNGRIPSTKLDEILKEIDEVDYPTSDPEIIDVLKKYGLASDDLLSRALGMPEGEAAKGQEDHAKRLARLAEAQTPDEVRGASDTQGNPGTAGQEDKELSRETDLDETSGDRTRGDAA